MLPNTRWNPDASTALTVTDPVEVHALPDTVTEHGAPSWLHVSDDDTSNVGKTASMGELVDGDATTCGIAIDAERCAYVPTLSCDATKYEYSPLANENVYEPTDVTGVAAT